MDEKRHWILRLLFSGLGIGIFNILLLGRLTGITWIFAYSLCWFFSYKRMQHYGNIK